MVARVYKPSSGAGVAWMAKPLRGWVRPPDIKNGDRLKVLQPLSNFTGAGTARTVQDRRVARHCGVERKVVSSSLAAAEDFSGHFFVLGILVLMFVFCTCDYSVSGVY